MVRKNRSLSTTSNSTRAKNIIISILIKKCVWTKNISRRKNFKLVNLNTVNFFSKINPIKKLVVYTPLNQANVKSQHVNF